VDSSDRLVPHTPVYTSGDQSLATHVLAPSVPVSDQPRMTTSQSTSGSGQGQQSDINMPSQCAPFNITVAIVPSFEAGDMLLMHGVAEQSARDEPHPSSDIAPPTTVSQPVGLTTLSIT